MGLLCFVSRTFAFDKVIGSMDSAGTKNATHVKTRQAAELATETLDHFSTLIDLEDTREVETSSSGVQWRISAPCESGKCTRTAAPSSVRYYPLHPRLYQITHEFPSDWLVNSMAAALADGSDKALRSILTEDVAGAVFSFAMVTEEFCTLLLDELAHYEASGHPVRRPNTMNRFGLVVNQIGLRPLMDALQRTCLQPLSAVLFPLEGSTFDAHHSFMVKYRQGDDTHLDMHHDDAEVTLNVCIGKVFTGATLSFCGAFGSGAHRRHVHTYTHVLGRAVLHRGAHRHGADQIASGERVSLIMWSTSSTFRLSDDYIASAIGRRRRGLEPPHDRVPDPSCLASHRALTFLLPLIYPASTGAPPSTHLTSPL